MNPLLAIFGLEMCADGWTTSQVLRFGGYEQSKIVAWIMLKIGKVPALVLVKVLPVIAVWYAVFIGQMPLQLLVALEVLYGYVIIRNWKALKQQKGLK